MNSLRRVISTELVSNETILRGHMTPFIQREDDINWIVMRSDDDITNAQNSIVKIHGSNEITRTVNIALIAARKTGRRISFSAMQRLLNESYDIPSDVLTLPDGLDESLLTDLFTPLSQSPAILFDTTLSENLGTIFANPGDLFILQGPKRVIFAKWISGSFYEVNLSISLEASWSGGPRFILSSSMLREEGFIYYRL